MSNTITTFWLHVCIDDYLTCIYLMTISKIQSSLIHILLELASEADCNTLRDLS